MQDKLSIEPGVLYVVATPIGNLGDISQRALDVLRAVKLVAAEDTRHSVRLLRHFGIQTALFALHEHNESRALNTVLQRLEGGDSVALISDAGTPLISDPGLPLVRAARQAGYRVVPVPGASAIITALSVAGLATDRFVFEGFLPAKSGARRERLRALADEPRTLILYEAPHRIKALLADAVEVLGADRQAVLAKELTKLHEGVFSGPLAELLALLEAEPERGKGEFVVLIKALPRRSDRDLDAEDERTLALLLEELPVRGASSLAARLRGKPRKAFYQRALALAREAGEADT